MSLLRAGLRTLPAAILGAAALASVRADEAPVPASALHACAVISAAGERLVCYDQLAGRASAAPSSPEPAGRAGLPPTTAAPPSSPAAAPTGSFGLYHAEHPAAPPPAPSLTGRIVGMGAAANGHPTVALEGGQLWELDDRDSPWPFMLFAGSAVLCRNACRRKENHEQQSSRDDAIVAGGV